MSVIETILEHVGLQLNTDRPAGVPEAVREREIALRSEDLPAIDFFQDFESVTGLHGRGDVVPVGTRTGEIVKRRLDVMVVCSAASTIDAAGVTTTRASAKLDPLRSWAISSICGADWSDVADGAVEVDTKFVYGNIDAPLAQAQIRFRVQYTSKFGSIAP